MGETETITVAEVSDGVGGVGTAGTDVSLPSVEVLTGRGFVTGKSGSGKSNTASVVIEKLLDRGFPVLIVDIDGEYYGLKEKYEILHVGDDEECDIQVSAEHAEKIADLALVENVPIILDVSSFLDEREAADLLTEVAKQLFAKEKKLKKPFLLVVEEVHEWIPEGGGMGECGRMLIKVGKRGRKHGLGIMGISQRPADVKKDFITQCDWLCWHRLTWRNDTKVVKRVLGSEYAEAVEGLNDGEAFLVTDWEEEVRRVQFQRKKTFDAGATPGLDDFQRPDLKSVSDDLVGELQTITEEQNAREDRIAELEAEVREKENRIEMLERDLEDARDLSQMADQFAAALFDHPGRSRMQLRRDREHEDDAEGTEQATLEESHDPAVETTPWPAPDADDPSMVGGSDDATASAEATDAEREAEASTAATNGTENTDDEAATDERIEAAMASLTGAGAVPETSSGGDDTAATNGTSGTTASAPTASDDWADAGMRSTSTSGERDASGSTSAGAATTPWPDASPAAARDDSTTADGAKSSDAGGSDGGEHGASAARADDERRDGDGRHGAEADGERPVVARARAVLSDLDEPTREMLVEYRDRGPCTPVDAHVATGGDGESERTLAYSKNSALREAGLIRHAGRGRYAYALPTFVAAASGDHLDEGVAEDVVEAIEAGLLR
ncbi:helicase HerA domain-containing protein [Halomarina salina]|uniref:Helicase HerA domain-containing protein n=1 Tax=Halomarina salina TaxID=1872699 RepID=A0ABD5RSF4_9EURY|nr:DUF87 domain-containing protein [Halomarina salina]